MAFVRIKTNGVSLPMRLSSKALFLSNGACGAMPKQQLLHDHPTHGIECRGVLSIVGLTLEYRKHNAPFLLSI